MVTKPVGGIFDAAAIVPIYKNQVKEPPHDDAKKQKGSAVNRSVEVRAPCGHACLRVARVNVDRSGIGCGGPGGDILWRGGQAWGRGGGMDGPGDKRGRE